MPVPRGLRLKTGQAYHVGCDDNDDFHFDLVFVPEAKRYLMSGIYPNQESLRQ